MSALQFIVLVYRNITTAYMKIGSLRIDVSDVLVPMARRLREAKRARKGKKRYNKNLQYHSDKPMSGAGSLEDLGPGTLDQ